VKRSLQVLGGVGLILWASLGLFAWFRSNPGSSHAPDGPEARAAEARLAALEDEIDSLHGDLRAMAEAMGTGLQTLHETLLAEREERELREHEERAASEARKAALRDEVGSYAPSPSSDELADLRRELQELRVALRARADSAPVAQLVPFPGDVMAAEEPVPPPPDRASADEIPPTDDLRVAGESEPDAAPAAEPSVPVESTPPEASVQAPRRSFLAFRLPSDDLRFDERRGWNVLPALSRVGFDARTTLHDFSATTSSLEGRLEADPSRPSETPTARLSVRAVTLDSGNADRDEAMRENLDVERFPAIDFELTAFETEEVDGPARSARGTAHGRMTIRGVTREVAMPVKLQLDESRRLCVDGEMPLDLESFGVPVPNKLGLITMDKEVRIWISLRLRAEPRTAG